MLKETKIKDEAELEAILVNGPEQIEENFIVLTHQRKTFGLKSLSRSQVGWFDIGRVND